MLNPIKGIILFFSHPTKYNARTPAFCPKKWWAPRWTLFLPSITLAFVRIPGIEWKYVFFLFQKGQSNWITIDISNTPISSCLTTLSTSARKKRRKRKGGMRCLNTICLWYVEVQQIFPLQIRSIHTFKWTKSTKIYISIKTMGQVERQYNQDLTFLFGIWA